jgi:hypothetical protein
MFQYVGSGKGHSNTKDSDRNGKFNLPFITLGEGRHYKLPLKTYGTNDTLSIQSQTHRPKSITGDPTCLTHVTQER